MGFTSRGYFVFPKLEGELGPKLHFREKNILNWSLNERKAIWDCKISGDYVNRY
jgi:hypothetical protein